jgi:hypothetical protein
MNNEIPKEIINDWNSFEKEAGKNKIGRIYEFSFLPSGIMSKIIYGFHNPNLKNLSLIPRFWKNGMLLAWNESHIWIEIEDLNLQNKKEKEKRKEKKEIKIIPKLKIICIGKEYKEILENVCFIIEEVIRKEYSNILNQSKKIIKFYYGVTNEWIEFSYDECLEKSKKNEMIIIEGKSFISAKNLFPEDKEKNEKQEYGKYKMIKGDKLGSGSYGNVFKCKFEELTGTYAIKEFKNDNSNSKKSFEQEKNILKEINHNRIILLLGSKEIENKIYLIFEYYDKSLKDLVSKENWINNNNSNNEIKLNLCYQIIEGIEYLHSKNIIHLDIKVKKIF